MSPKSSVKEPYLIPRDTNLGGGGADEPQMLAFGLDSRQTRYRKRGKSPGVRQKLQNGPGNMCGARSSPRAHGSSSKIRYNGRRAPGSSTVLSSCCSQSSGARRTRCLCVCLCVFVVCLMLAELWRAPHKVSVCVCVCLCLCVFVVCLMLAELWRAPHKVSVSLCVCVCVCVCRVLCSRSSGVRRTRCVCLCVSVCVSVCVVSYARGALACAAQGMRKRALHHPENRLRMFAQKIASVCHPTKESYWPTKGSYNPKK